MSYHVPGLCSLGNRLAYAYIDRKHEMLKTSARYSIEKHSYLLSLRPWFMIKILLFLPISEDQEVGFLCHKEQGRAEGNFTQHRASTRVPGILGSLLLAVKGICISGH